MLRTVILRSQLVALVRTVRAATCVEERPHAPVKPPPMRTSELPIYNTPHAEYGEYKESKSIEEITNFIIEMQRECTKYINILKCAADYLQEEENKISRSGAIATGGLASFILSGGSIFRRLRYMGVGSLLASAVCFPDKRQEIVNLFIILIYNLCRKKPED